VALLLNDYLSRMTDVIFKYDGTLDKYIGDAIMAVFGGPRSTCPTTAGAAIKAALEMRDADGVQRRRKETGGPACGSGSASTSGRWSPARSAAINKKEYTVPRHTVNTASRLESWSPSRMMVVMAAENHPRGRPGPVRDPPALGKATLKGQARHEVGRFRGAGRRTACPRPRRSRARTARCLIDERVLRRTRRGSRSHLWSFS